MVNYEPFSNHHIGVTIPELCAYSVTNLHTFFLKNKLGVTSLEPLASHVTSKYDSSIIIYLSETKHDAYHKNH